MNAWLVLLVKGGVKSIEYLCGDRPYGFDGEATFWGTSYFAGVYP
jgi:hypothetical protein